MQSIRMKTRQLGQGLTEYAIIVALVAVAAIGVMGFFGDTVTAQLSGIAQEVAGNDGSADQAAASNAGDEASTAGSQTPHTMGNYTDNGQP
ncbi:MAG: Flp family type IVb pilin [Gammaproteobacteria bacterium]